MEQTLTAKIQIYPDKDAQAVFIQTMSAYRQACNHVSKHVFSTRCLKQPDIQKVTYTDLRATYGLRSQMAISVVRTVISKYKTILENQHEWVEAIFKKPQLDLVWNRDYSLTRSGMFSVNTLSGRVKVAYATNGMSQYFDGTWEFGTAKLVFKHNKWFLHIPCTQALSECLPTTIKNIVGTDFGMNFLTTSYDSQGQTTFVSGRFVKDKRAHYQKVRKSLQQRQTPSARRRLKKIGQRENRWMHDVNHQVSKALVTNSPKNTLFVLEDLTGIRNATEKVKRKDRYYSVSWAFYDLRKLIEYKALSIGALSVTVSPAYTSQTCPKCGHTERANRNKKKHVFICKTCGYQSNDDRVAAMNLHRKGIEYLSAVI